MTTNYQRGYHFERKIRKYLENKDFYVMRSGGSHNIADLIAITKEKNLSRTYLIQCKSGSSKMSAADKDKLANAAKEIGAYGILAHQVGRVVKYIWIRGNKYNEKEINL